MPRLNYEDDFELMLLRECYFKKVKYFNEHDFKQFRKIAKITAHKMFKRHITVFEAVGFDLDDLEALADVYLMEYMGGFSIRQNVDKLNKFLDEFKSKYNKDPSLADINKAEVNLLINFLRQKISYSAKVCEKKSRNIVINKEINFAIAATNNSKEVENTHILIDKWKELGYRKLSNTEKKMLKKTNSQTDNQGFKVFFFQEYAKPIFELDFVYNDSDDVSLRDNNLHSMYGLSESLENPEDILINKEDELDANSYTNKFNTLTTKQQKSMITNFITNNKNNTYLKKEIKFARKMIKQLRRMV